jgi:2-polyprenyl-6-methoxyphenol hydroxylase-like FAD-dependent oxidoreductase
LNFSDVQWIVDPENWFVIARINRHGLWRIVYGESPDMSIEQIKDRLPERFRRTLPGHPEPGQYEVANVSPYVCHQRCAERMSDGRILLAGDAAHLNNPM